MAVDADRKNGIQQLLAISPKPQVVLLDDAYQHRRVKAGLYILLTAYDDIYSDDFLLPAGNLRESRSGADRAAVIIVTKCPVQLSKEAMDYIVRKLRPNAAQHVYFTTIEYDHTVYSDSRQIDAAEAKKLAKILVAGIAKPKPFFDHLQRPDDEVLAYPDHHDFTDAELAELEHKSIDRIIITTEKDYVRLRGKLPANRLFYLPIKTRFLKGSGNFDKTILNYVGKSTGNS